MTISIFNKKGGVGKTSLAFSIAKDLDFKLISNDDSVIEDVYSKATITNKPVLIKEDCVYDFGGFIDLGTKNILDKSDLIIIPFSSDFNSFKKTMLTIKELTNNNIVLVATNSEKEDFVEILELLKSKYSFPIFEIQKSRIWKKTFAESKSVLELKNESALSKYAYRNSLKGYIELLNYIKKV